MVGRLFSIGEGLFSGTMLVSGRVNVALRESGTLRNPLRSKDGWIDRFFFQQIRREFWDDWSTVNHQLAGANSDEQMSSQDGHFPTKCSEQMSNEGWCAPTSLLWNYLWRREKNIFWLHLFQFNLCIHHSSSFLSKTLVYRPRADDPYSSSFELIVGVS